MLSRCIIIFFFVFRMMSNLRIFIVFGSSCFVYMKKNSFVPSRISKEAIISLVYHFDCVYLQFKQLGIRCSLVAYYFSLRLQMPNSKSAKNSYQFSKTVNIQNDRAHSSKLARSPIPSHLQLGMYFEIVVKKIPHDQ